MDKSEPVEAVEATGQFDEKTSGQSNYHIVTHCDIALQRVQVI